MKNLILSLSSLLNFYGIPDQMSEGISNVYFEKDYCYTSDNVITPAYYEENKITKSINIHICKGASNKDFIHEIGHVVCEKHNNPYPFGTGDSKLDYTSLYAQVGKEEDCAETFTDYYYYKKFGDCNNLRATAKRSRVLLRKCLIIKKWHKNYAK